MCLANRFQAWTWERMITRTLCVSYWVTWSHFSSRAVVFVDRPVFKKKLHFSAVSSCCCCKKVAVDQDARMKSSPQHDCVSTEHVSTICYCKTPVTRPPASDLSQIVGSSHFSFVTTVLDKYQTIFYTCTEKKRGNCHPREWEADEIQSITHSDFNLKIMFVDTFGQCHSVGWADWMQPLTVSSISTLNDQSHPVRLSLSGWEREKKKKKTCRC